MITAYKAISFARHDIVEKDDLDQLQNNLQWVLENTPRGAFYGGNGKVTNVNTVMLCGRIGIGKSKKETNVNTAVRFGRAFAPNCHPNVTTGIVSDSVKQIWAVTNGPGGQGLPNSTGFDIVVSVEDLTPKDKWAIKKPFYVFWQAFGYRNEDLDAL